MARNQGPRPPQGETQAQAKERKDRAACDERVRDLNRYVPKMKGTLAKIEQRLSSAGTEEARDAIRRSSEFINEFTEDIFGLGSTDFYRAPIEKYGNDQAKALSAEYQAAHDALEAEGEKAFAAYKAQLTDEDKARIAEGGALVNGFNDTYEALMQFVDRVDDDPTAASGEEIQEQIGKAEWLRAEAPGIRAKVDSVLGEKVQAYKSGHPYGGDDDENLAPLEKTFLLPLNERSGFTSTRTDKFVSHISKIIEDLEGMRKGAGAEF